MQQSRSIQNKIEEIVREEWGRILANLVKTLGDFQLAEDSLQEALISALKHWQRNGLPNSPAAWLMQTARRKAIDKIRRDQNFSQKTPEIAYLFELDAADNELHPVHKKTEAIPDKRLEMIFTCCHPAIEEKSRLALTLHTLGGLSTREVANAFLDKTEAMAARLTRAKKKISAAKIPYEIPGADILQERLKSVLQVIYLIFNESYASSNNEKLIRPDLTKEALKLVKILRTLMPDECEPQGLEALILLHDARRPSRTDNNHNIIALEHQNRSNWDHKKIAKGTTILKQALARGKIGSFQIQAAISACHCEAKTWQDTDWAQISALYQLLYAIEPSPVILLNKAYANSHTDNLKDAFKQLCSLEPELENYQPFYATKADLLTRLGDLKSASSALETALELSCNESEKRFLKNKLAALCAN